MKLKNPNYVAKDFEGVTVIRFTVENLTIAHDLERMRTEIEAMVDTGGLRKLVLDYKLVKYVSSAALGLMIAVNQKLKALGGQLVISHPESIAELLKVSRTEKLFLIAPDPKVGARMIKQAGRS